MEVSGQLHAVGRFPSGESPPPKYPLDRRLGGPPSWTGRGGKEKISCPCRESNHGCSARTDWTAAAQP
jgi:hypothetical protein